MLRPKIERTTTFIEVQCLVVSPSDARKMTGNVVDDRLDRMRRSKLVLVDVRDEAAPQIMQNPRRHRLLNACITTCLGDARIQFGLGFRPSAEAAGAAAEHKIPLFFDLDGIEDLESFAAQRDKMRPTILRSRCG